VTSYGSDVARIEAPCRKAGQRTIKVKVFEEGVAYIRCTASKVR